MAWYDKKIFDKNRIFNLNVLIGERDYEGRSWELGYAQPALKDYLTNNLGLDYKKGDNLIFKNADGNWEHYVLMDVNRVTHSDAWARVNFDPYHLVTQNEDGIMLKEDKKKLDSISVLSDGSAAINSDIKVTSGNMGGFAPSFAIVHDYGGQTSGISFSTNDSNIFNFNMINERSVAYNSNIRTGIITTKMYDWETTVPNENNEQYKDENGISLNSGTELKRQYVKIPVIFSEKQKMPNTKYIVLVSYVGYKPSYDISIDTNGKTTDGFNIVIGRSDTTSINLLTLHWLVIPYQKNDTNVEPTVYYE